MPKQVRKFKSVEDEAGLYECYLNDVDNPTHIILDKEEALALWNAFRRVYISNPEVREILRALANFGGGE